MKVGTDSVILGALCDITDVKKALDVGTGTGVIALMIAQRTKAQIDGIELINENFRECEQNFSNSPWSDRLNAIHADYRNLEQDKSYDLIISNPPYFEISSENKTESSRNIARSQVHLTLQNLISQSASLLAKYGRFVVIIPKGTETEFRKFAIHQNLHCIRSVNIIGRKDKSPTRVVLEFSQFKTPENKEEITIETFGRHDYTKEYLGLMSDFLFLE